MTVHDDLVPVLKRQRMSGVLQTLQLRIQQAIDDALAHYQFRYRLLSDEVERRDSKQLSRRLRRARFDHDKTLPHVDFQFNSGFCKARVVSPPASS